ncbi:unnamed protein product [Calicophoron daubneyi]|uniref:Uncharacterized protein n=1 Tax=Calicophoron daubneyi TaxID=300641 RepID=A0AAV2TVL8_CALDB
MPVGIESPQPIVTRLPGPANTGFPSFQTRYPIGRTTTQKGVIVPHSKALYDYTRFSFLLEPFKRRAKSADPRIPFNGGQNGILSEPKFTQPALVPPASASEKIHVNFSPVNITGSIFERYKRRRNDRNLSVGCRLSVPVDMPVKQSSNHSQPERNQQSCLESTIEDASGRVIGRVRVNSHVRPASFHSESTQSSSHHNPYLYQNSALLVGCTRGGIRPDPSVQSSKFDAQQSFRGASSSNPDTNSALMYGSMYDYPPSLCPYPCPTVRLEESQTAPSARLRLFPKRPPRPASIDPFLLLRSKKHTASSSQPRPSSDLFDSTTYTGCMHSRHYDQKNSFAINCVVQSPTSVDVPLSSGRTNRGTVLHDDSSNAVGRSKEGRVGRAPAKRSSIGKKVKMDCRGNLFHGTVQHYLPRDCMSDTCKVTVCHFAPKSCSTVVKHNQSNGTPRSHCPDRYSLLSKAFLNGQVLSRKHDHKLQTDRFSAGRPISDIVLLDTNEKYASTKCNFPVCEKSNKTPFDLKCTVATRQFNMFAPGVCTSDFPHDFQTSVSGNKIGFGCGVTCVTGANVASTITPQTNCNADVILASATRSFEPHHFVSGLESVTFRRGDEIDLTLEKRAAGIVLHNSDPYSRAAPGDETRSYIRAPEQKEWLESANRLGDNSCSGMSVSSSSVAGINRALLSNVRGRSRPPASPVIPPPQPPLRTTSLVRNSESREFASFDWKKTGENSTECFSTGQTRSAQTQNIAPNISLPSGPTQRNVNNLSPLPTMVSSFSVGSNQNVLDSVADKEIAQNDPVWWSRLLPYKLSNLPSNLAYRLKQTNLNASRTSPNSRLSTISSPSTLPHVFVPTTTSNANVQSKNQQPMMTQSLYERSHTSHPEDIVGRTNPLEVLTHHPRPRLPIRPSSLYVDKTDSSDILLPSLAHLGIQPPMDDLTCKQEVSKPAEPSNASPVKVPPSLLRYSLDVSSITPEALPNPGVLSRPPLKLAFDNCDSPLLGQYCRLLILRTTVAGTSPTTTTTIHPSSSADSSLTPT